MAVLPLLASALLLTSPLDTAGARTVASHGTPRADSGTIAPIGRTSAGPVESAVGLQRPDPAGADTVRRRTKAFVYSDGYATRTTIHRWLSWGMLPLFAASYVSGNQLINKGSDAPEWAERMHGPAATATAVLFGANAVTGSWNLWEGRKDPNGRTRRFLHSALFMAASGGFAYTGTKLANEAEQSFDRRRTHRNMAVASMGVATSSWLIMLIGN
jgi:hypothetical protein